MAKGGGRRMKEILGNLWDYYGRPSTVILITTNNYVKTNGQAVMGRGCALEAKKRFPRIAARLGHMLQLSKDGLNVVEKGLWTFPVKHRWDERADLDLIRKSATYLGNAARDNPQLTFVLPRPGCGNGGRLWMEVKPVICDLLPDNVWVIDFANKH
jgi:hypothetical protein